MEKKLIWIIIQPVAEGEKKTEIIWGAKSSVVRPLLRSRTVGMTSEMTSNLLFASGPPVKV